MSYPPNGSNYHDHMCNCLGCSGDYSPEEQAMIEQEHNKKRSIMSNTYYTHDGKYIGTLSTGPMRRKDFTWHMHPHEFYKFVIKTQTMILSDDDMPLYLEEFLKIAEEREHHSFQS